MKIKKLEHNYANTLYEVIDKVNEIIDVLNNSFITNDPDKIHTSTTLATDISCDRLTPLVNETTCELTVDKISNMIEGGGIYSDIKCPKCNARHFVVGSSSMTCVYYPTIIKDGKNINPDRNKCTTEYECMECGYRWEE